MGESMAQLAERFGEGDRLKREIKKNLEGFRYAI